MFTIYALTDPTGAIRYVGKTIDPVYRLRCHRRILVKAPHSYRGCWIYSLQQQGAQPDMVVCDTCDDKVTANELERAWIKLFRGAGMPLTNLTDGGDGISGLHHSIEARKKISEAGLRNQHSLGYKHTPRAKEKIRQAQLGRPRATSYKYTPEGKEKMSQARRGKKKSLEAREKIRLGVLAWWKNRRVEE